MALILFASYLSFLLVHNHHNVIKFPEKQYHLYASFYSCKKKHKDDIASLEILLRCDDCELIKKIGNWQIELTPNNNFIEENNYPDWYGYQKIDGI